MAALIPEETVDAIRESIDIVDLIGEYVALKKRGSSYVGLCPFHAEKTPSFSVSSDKQLYYCFGCGTGGSSFNFLMEIEGLSFPEAVEKLALRGGIELPGDVCGPEQSEQQKLQNKIEKINSLAEEFFYFVLTQYGAGKKGLEYLKARGVDQETIKSFRLGFAPDKWDALISYLQRRKIPLELQVDAGLAVKRKTGGGAYDRFRGRVIFPIHDAQKRVIGFGGRILENGQPKYLNSPQTALFDKGTVLYGLDLAKESIRIKKHVIVMEGYMDVITAHQFGIGNAVASLGTALTDKQAKLLKRYTENVIIAYDADAAGEAATLRGLDILRDQGLKVRVLQLPPGEDPDDFIRAQGGELFEELINTAQPVINYKLDLFLKNASSGFEGRIEVANRLLPDLKKLSNEIERREYIKILSNRLHLSEEAIIEELDKKQVKLQENGIKQDKKVKSRHNSKREIPNVSSAYLKAQHIILRAMIFSEDIIKSSLEKEIIFQDFSDPEKEVAEAIISAWNDNSKAIIEPVDMIKRLQQENAKRLMAKIEMEEMELTEEIIRDSIRTIKSHEFQKQLKTLRRQLSNAEAEGATSTVTAVIKEITVLQSELRELNNT